MLTIRSCPATRHIKEAQSISTRPNPPKDGDEKPRVLASSEKPIKNTVSVVSVIPDRILIVEDDVALASGLPVLRESDNIVFAQVSYC